MKTSSKYEYLLFKEDLITKRYGIKKYLKTITDAIEYIKEMKKNKELCANIKKK